MIIKKVFKQFVEVSVWIRGVKRYGIHEAGGENAFALLFSTAAE